MREKKSEEKRNQRQQKKKQGRTEEEERKKRGESGPEQQQRRNQNENRKKETTATFKPRIPAAATAPLSRCHRHLQPRIPAAATALLSSRHRSATENSRQHHRQLSHPRSAPQVNSLSPLAAGPNSSSCLQNVHCARSACKKKIISRLLCMRTVTGYMGFFPSPVGWNISPARAAGLSPTPFCSGLEHQPSPRGWAESILVAGPIQAQPSPFHFIFFLLFVLCVFFIIYIYFLKVVIFPRIFLRHFD